MLTTDDGLLINVKGSLLSNEKSKITRYNIIT